MICDVGYRSCCGLKGVVDGRERGLPHQITSSMHRPYVSSAAASSMGSSRNGRIATGNVAPGDYVFGFRNRIRAKQS